MWEGILIDAQIVSFRQSLCMFCFFPFNWPWIAQMAVIHALKCMVFTKLVIVYFPIRAFVSSFTSSNNISVFNSLMSLRLLSLLSNMINRFFYCGGKLGDVVFESVLDILSV